MHIHSDIRRIGLDLNHWFPVGRSKEFALARPVGREIWGAYFVICRDEQGQVHAFEDRCLHRKVQLSLGSVRDGRLICPYHGWEYDWSGCIKKIPHGDKVPNAKLKSFPVREEGGLVWLFP